MFRHNVWYAWWLGLGLIRCALDLTSHGRNRTYVDGTQVYMFKRICLITLHGSREFGRIRDGQAGVVVFFNRTKPCRSDIIHTSHFSNEVHFPRQHLRSLVAR